MTGHLDGDFTVLGRRQRDDAVLLHLAEDDEPALADRNLKADLLLTQHSRPPRHMKSPNWTPQIVSTNPFRTNNYIIFS